MSTNFSALWSSLCTLELTRRYTSTPAEPDHAYKTSFFRDTKDKKLHKQHQKLASALAYICATSPGAENVTACSVEVSYPAGNDTNNSMIILRVAQNKEVEREEITKLQSLVDGFVNEVSTLDESDWSTKDGAFFVVQSESDIKFLTFITATRTVQHRPFHRPILFSPSL